MSSLASATAHHEAGHTVVAYLAGHSISSISIDLRPGARYIGISLHHANGPTGVDLLAGQCLILAAGMVAERAHDPMWVPAANAGDDDREETIERLINTGTPASRVRTVRLAADAEASATLSDSRVWDAVRAVADLVLARLGANLVATVPGVDIDTAIQSVLTSSDCIALRGLLYPRIAAVSALR